MRDALLIAVAVGYTVYLARALPKRPLPE